LIEEKKKKEGERGKRERVIPSALFSPNFSATDPPWKGRGVWKGGKGKGGGGKKRRGGTPFLCLSPLPIHRLREGSREGKKGRKEVELICFVLLPHPYWLISVAFNPKNTAEDKRRREGGEKKERKKRGVVLLCLLSFLLLSV